MNENGSVSLLAILLLNIYFLRY